jgi:Flp pilus assembly pilin Flp
MRFMQFVSQFHREESGQDMLEYALVLAAVLAAVVTGSGSLGTTIGDALDTINLRIQASASGPTP